MAEEKSDLTGWLVSRSELRGSLPVVDLVGCTILLGVFVWYFLQAADLPAPLNKIDIGAGGFPYLLAVATIAAIIAVAIAAIVRMLDPVPVRWVAVRRPLSIAAGAAFMILEGIWFEKIGAVASILIFALATMLACGERRLLHLVGVPVLLAGFIYGVFVLALSVNLP